MFNLYLLCRTLTTLEGEKESLAVVTLCFNSRILICCEISTKQLLSGTTISINPHHPPSPVPLPRLLMDNGAIPFGAASPWGTICGEPWEGHDWHVSHFCAFSPPNIRKKWNPCRRTAEADGAGTLYMTGKCVMQKHQRVYFCTVGVGGNVV